ncbi:unnamed protein product [Sphagnum jensenii]|uniref:Uncharacterized protein n=1 Tax=Sphagnum jensenii TaxID=128206 RepID=A0ABP0VIE4_9BRYO
MVREVSTSWKDTHVDQKGDGVPNQDRNEGGAASVSDSDDESDDDDEDFGEEIQDIIGAQADVPEGGAELLCALTGEEIEWMGVRRKDRRLIQHNACCFGINHRKYVNDHQLFMLDVASEEDLSEESVPAQFLQKVELIANIHNNVLLNVGQAQK